jgi:hypothetical protein
VTPRQIDRFLKTLAAEVGTPARAYLTGAAAAALWGRVRPSLDVDLGLELKRGAKADWESIERAVERTTRLTGIPVNIAEDIDRWGMITLLDYRRSSRRYRQFGLLEVRLLHPANWSIGKLTRNLDADIRDVAEVFRRQTVPVAKVASTWGRALRASPASTTQFQFRRNVEHFFHHRGRAIWGASFDPAAAIASFQRASRIAADVSRRST